MAKNKLKDPVIEEPAPEEIKPPVKKTTFKSNRKFVRFTNIFGVVSRNQIVHSMPFILFVTILIMIYISNSYYAEGIIRDIDRTKKELKEKRAQYITTMSRLMYVSNQSEVAKMVSGLEIKESTVPPFRIIKQKKLK